MKSTAEHSPAPAAEAFVEPMARNTTLKVAPEIGAGLRLSAAASGSTVSEFAEEAVRLILKKHNRKVGELPPKIRSGRPAVTLDMAVRSIADHPLTRNDAIPTRIGAGTAESLESLARKLGKRNGDLAADGALELIRERGPALAKDLAGLTSPRAQAAAREKMRAVADGRARIEIHLIGEDRTPQLEITQVPEAETDAGNA